MTRTLLAALVGLSLSLGGTTVLAQSKANNVGTVESVKLIKQEGEGTGVGAVAGGVLGGVLGNQIGSGRGNTAATVAGAAGGAYVGHQAEKKMKEKEYWQVVVRMNDGEKKTITTAKQPSVQVGDKTKVVNGKLVPLQ